MENREEDSKDSWKYVIVVSKFALHFLEASVSKSFGVLIPGMVVLFNTKVSVLGLVCSFPVTWMLITCPIVAHLLKNARVNQRAVALIGALLGSSCIIASGYIRSVVALGVFLTLLGLGSAMSYMPTLLLLNQYFPRRFVLMSTVTQLGSTVGILLVPILVERCNRAYGYTGAMLILGGILLHSVAAASTLRPPRPKARCPGRQEDEENGQYIPVNQEDGNISNLEDNNTNNADGATVQKKQINNAEDSPLTIESNPETDQEQDVSGEESKDPRSSHNRNPVLQWFVQCIFIQQPMFTLTLPANFLIQYVAYAWMLLLVPRAEWLGIVSQDAVLLSTLGGVGAMAGSIFLMVILYFGADSFHICLINSAVAASTFLVDYWITSYPAMCAMAFIQGWVLFTNTALRAAFCKMTTTHEYFGLACAYSALIGGIGGNAGGLVSGLIFDATQSFQSVFVSIGGVHCLILVNILIYLLIDRYKKLKTRPESE